MWLLLIGQVLCFIFSFKKYFLTKILLDLRIRFMTSQTRLNKKEGLIMARNRQLQEAKSKFSEVIDEALSEGPQIITRRGYILARFEKSAPA